VSLGEKIASLRKQRGWTQDLFAEKVGVHKNHVTRWETGRMKPSTNTLRKIASVLGISLEALMDSNSVPVDLTEDPELFEKCRLLQELEPEDRAVVYRMIDTFAKQKRLAQMLIRA
jgi:transcriptional regulator with XRE-family HTH domain